MDPTASPHGIDTVIANDEVWFFRLGRRLGLYRAELTHSTIYSHIMAVPRHELAYWQARLEDLKRGVLPDGPAKGMFVHESVHARQMSGKAFWRWGLHYLLSRKFRRRMEEEAYTVHLTYLARCGRPIEATYWMRHFRDLYFGAFRGRHARAAFDRISAAIRREVPEARIVEDQPADRPAA